MDGTKVDLDFDEHMGAKCPEKSKVFMVWVMLAMRPLGKKVVARWLSDGSCLGCQITKETIKYLFWECPTIKDLIRKVCLWFNRKFKVSFFKTNLILGLRGLC